MNGDKVNESTSCTETRSCVIPQDGGLSTFSALTDGPMHFGTLKGDDAAAAPAPATAPVQAPAATPSSPVTSPSPVDYASYHTRHMLQASPSPSAASPVPTSPEPDAAASSDNVGSGPAKLIWILGTRRRLLQQSVHAVRPSCPAITLPINCMDAHVIGECQCL